MRQHWAAEQQAVAVVPGVAFHAPDYVRLSYALSLEKSKMGLERLQAFCAGLR